MYKPEATRVNARVVDSRNIKRTGNDYRLQRIYLQRLKDYTTPIRALLDSPVEILDDFAFQGITVVQNNVDNKKLIIQSNPLLRQQIAAFFSEVLLKTKYTELRRIERAFIDRSRTNRKDYYVVDSEEISAIFGSIAEELEHEAKAPIIFLAPRDQFMEDGSRDIEDSQKDILIPQPRTPSDIARFNEEFLRYRFHYAIIPGGNAKTLVQFLKIPAVCNQNVWLTDNQDTPLHSAARSQNTKWSKELIDIIMNTEDESWNCPLGAWELINFQNKQKNTALHLAVENESTQVAQCLIENGANIVARNCNDVTPLERMYEKTPEAVIQVLQMAIVPGAGLPDDGNLSLSLDFRAVVGWSSQAKTYEKEQTQIDSIDLKSPAKTLAEENPLIKNLALSIPNEDECPDPILEMDLLAKMVYQNFYNSASVILPHVIVRTFLDLKWNKLKWPIYLLTLFYILIYLIYTTFVIRIFISWYPYVTNGTLNDSDPENPLDVDLTVWNYIWGIWVHPASGIDLDPPISSQSAMVDPIAAVMLLLLGSIYVLLEVYEFYLIQKVAAGSPIQGLLYYIGSFENVLQLIFSVCALFITSVGFWNESRLENWTYWVAAWSVVLAWVLILLQLGNIYGVGKYVQMFKTVIKRFAVVMATYVCFLVGFSIAFSILFPKDRFATFPMSFFRSISMMAGELNFDEVLDPEKIRPFPFATQAVHFGFTVTVTIVLINLLTGLTVDDVGKIFKESDVIHRSIQVERLYVVEQMLHRWRTDLYVIPNEKRCRGSTCTLETQISKLPCELHKELRLLYADPEEYAKQYLQSE